MIFHFILVALGAIVGYDIIRRLVGTHIPGVVARVIIATIGVVLWMTCPLPILIGLGAAGAATILGPWISVEDVTPWFQQMLKRDRQTQRKPGKVVQMADIAREVSKAKKPSLGNRIPII